ncbi:MAG: hypothetical protein JWR69_75 [Pedosphaera sp.]|nr:hypothetical protein [Pedosphaera sp.]
MNPKNTWILVVLAGGLFAFIYFFERHLHPPVPPAPKVLSGFKAAAVTSIQIQPAGQLEIRADRTNGTWQLTKPLAYPAQAVAIETLLQSLEELSYKTHISAQEFRDRPKANEDYGFDAPLFTLLVQQGAGMHQLKFGKLTAPGDQVYIQVVGAEGVDVVGTDIFKFIPRQKNDWRDTAFVNLKDVPFDRLTVTNGSKVFELQRDATNKLWRMTRPMQARADNPKIEELLYKLQSLHISRFETDDPADLEPYGLHPASWELALGQGTNQLCLLQFGKSPTNDDSRLYARCGGNKGVVLIGRESVEPWRADHEKFRDARLAGFTSGALDAVEVSGQENFTLQRQTNDVWQIITKSQNLPADPERTREFVEALARLEIAPSPGRFAYKDVVTESDFPTYGLASPVRKYILKRTLASNAGGSTNQVIAQLDFGSLTNDNKIFARRGDRPEETSVYVVKVEDFQRLPATSLALRERRIWSFSEDAAMRVTIRQNGTAQILQHAGTNKWVVASGSQGIINPFAVEAGVQELGELAAENWVACAAPNRAQYGFSDKSIRISVEFAGEDSSQALTLELGGSAANGLRYGAVRLDGQEWIFELSRKQLERIISDFNIRENSPP